MECQVNRRENSAMVTQAQLHELFDYDADTGHLIRKVARQSVKVGDIAGTITNRGYRHISINGRNYQAHRLVWFYHHGEWPNRQIDHIDRDKLNNRIENLRDVSCSINQLNKTKSNSTGYAGVARHRGRFKAHIGISGKLAHLGIFDTPEAAHEAFKAAHIGLYGTNSQYYEVAA